jgi:hypothetical protein
LRKQLYRPHLALVFHLLAVNIPHLSSNRRSITSLTDLRPSLYLTLAATPRKELRPWMTKDTKVMWQEIIRESEIMRLEMVALRVVSNLIAIPFRAYD